MTVGFLGGCRNSGGPAPTLTVTRDGGKTWGSVVLPHTAASDYSLGSPVFVNAEQGFVDVTAQIYQGNTVTPSDYLAVTDDGGQTWRALPPFSIPGYVQALGFVDLNHFVALVTDGKGPGESVYLTTDGGRTWTGAGDLPEMFQNYPEIMFVDEQHGFIDEPSQTIGGQPLAFFATDDGGRTWKDMNPTAP